MICRNSSAMKKKEIHDMFQLPGKLLAQNRILSRNTDGTVLVALPHRPIKPSMMRAP